MPAPSLSRSHVEGSTGDGPTGFSRRSFLKRAGVVALGASSASALSGLVGPLASASSPRAALAKVGLQLDYLPNVQFAGSLMAASRGYYKAGGLDVTILPGGPNLSPEPVVVSGRALVGVTHTAEGLQAIANGAPLTVIGATFQKSPTCIVSRASHPIRNPKEMIGKTIGVSDTNLPIWNAFLKVNKIPASAVKVNTVQFSPQPLASGQIDGLVGFYTNEPIILDLQGVKTYAFLLNDFGYPIVDDIYIVRTADLKDPTLRGQIVALMTGEAKGWRAAFADPSEAAHLAVDVYGKKLGLSLQQQYLDMKAQGALVMSPATDQHGLFWMTPEVLSETIHSLALGGTKASPSSFTNEILAEVYAHGVIS
ncbi:MAG: ABC transporter substrate-binding protein [Actinomycetota bacterium]|nr:ABC transporter substrate-binding protein [Actinomycetota bacterium]